MRRLLVLVTITLLALTAAVVQLPQPTAVAYGHATVLTRQIVCNGMPLPC